MCIKRHSHKLRTILFAKIDKINKKKKEKQSVNYTKTTPKIHVTSQ